VASADDVDHQHISTPSTLARMHAAPSLSDYTDIQLLRAYTSAFVRLCCSLKLESDAGPRSLSDALDLMDAAERVLAKWKDPTSVTAVIVRKCLTLGFTKAVSPGTTLEPSWAGALTNVKPLIEAFVARVARCRARARRAPSSGLALCAPAA